jgi:hypothetical protein
MDTMNWKTNRGDNTKRNCRVKKKKKRKKRGLVYSILATFENNFAIEALEDFV